jgi:hypothetical protein
MQKEVVTVVLRHLNENIDEILASIHSLYSLFVQAIKDIERDQEVVIPLISRLIPSFHNLNVMNKASRFDVHNRLKALKPTHALVKSLQE